MKKMIDEENINIRRYPPEVLAQLRTYTEEILQEMADADPFSKKVYESYSNFRNRIVEWGSLTEKVFYNDIQI